MRHSLVSGLVAAFAVLTMPVCARAAAATADSVVERYLRARGGLAAITSVRTLEMRGAYDEGSLHIPAFIARMRPNMRAVQDPREHPDFMEGFDNAAWEFYADPGIVLRTTGPAEASSRRGAEFDDPLVDFRAKGHTVQLLGSENIGGRLAFRLHVTLSDGAELDKFIDEQSALLVAERHTAPQHAFGKSVPTQTLIGDYVEAAGVRYPTAYREVEIATGRVLNTLRWKSIEANVHLAESMFSPPSLRRSPLQRLLATLYDERYDATVALAAYRAFKGAPATAVIDTEDGVEFVGYQCVKMAAYSTAIALLKANAEDYPSSPAARFGLGRAYRAAALTQPALDAFRSALRLDPKYTRASDAIAAMGQ